MSTPTLIHNVIEAGLSFLEHLLRWAIVDCVSECTEQQPPPGDDHPDIEPMSGEDLEPIPEDDWPY
jgi:hypothetical protein